METITEKLETLGNAGEEIESQSDPSAKAKPSDVEETMTEAEAKIEEARTNVQETDKESPFPTNMEHGDAEEDEVKMDDSAVQNVEAGGEDMATKNDTKMDADRVKEKPDIIIDVEESEKNENGENSSENQMGDVAQNFPEVTKKPNCSRCPNFKIPPTLVSNDRRYDDTFQTRMRQERREEEHDADDEILEKAIENLEREQSVARKRTQECEKNLHAAKAKLELWRSKSEVFKSATVGKEDGASSGKSEEPCSQELSSIPEYAPGEEDEEDVEPGPSQDSSQESSFIQEHAPGEEEVKAGPSQDMEATSRECASESGLKLFYEYSKAKTSTTLARRAEFQAGYELHKAQRRLVRRQMGLGREGKKYTKPKRSFSAGSSCSPEEPEKKKKAKETESKQDNIAGVSEEREYIDKKEIEMLCKDLTFKAIIERFVIEEGFFEPKEIEEKKVYENGSSSEVMKHKKDNTKKCENTQKKDEKEDEEGAVKIKAIEESSEETEESARAPDEEVKEPKIVENAQNISERDLKEKIPTSTSEEESNEPEIVESVQKISGGDLKPLDIQDQTRECASKEKLKEQETIEDSQNISEGVLKPSDLQEKIISSTSEDEFMEPDIFEAVKICGGVPKPLDLHKMIKEYEEAKEPGVAEAVPSTSEGDPKPLDQPKDTKESPSALERFLLHLAGEQEAFEDLPKSPSLNAELSGVEEATSTTYEIGDDEDKDLIMQVKCLSDYIETKAARSHKLRLVTEEKMEEEKEQAEENNEVTKKEEDKKEKREADYVTVKVDDRKEKKEADSEIIKEEERKEKKADSGFIKGDERKDKKEVDYVFIKKAEEHKDDETGSIKGDEKKVPTGEKEKPISRKENVRAAMEEAGPSWRGDEEEGQVLRVGECLPLGAFPANRVTGEQAPGCPQLPRTFETIFGEKEDVSSCQSDASALAPVADSSNISASKVKQVSDATKDESEASASEMADKVKVDKEVTKAETYFSDEGTIQVLDLGVYHNKYGGSAGNEKDEVTRQASRFEAPNDGESASVTCFLKKDSVPIGIVIGRPLDVNQGDAETGASANDAEPKDNEQEAKEEQAEGAAPEQQSSAGDSTEPRGTPGAPAPRSRWGQWMRRLLRGLAPRDSSSQLPKTQSECSAPTLVLGLGAARRYPAGPSVSSLVRAADGGSSNTLSRMSVFRSRTVPAAGAKTNKKPKKMKKDKEKNKENEQQANKEEEIVKEEQMDEEKPINKEEQLIKEEEVNEEKDMNDGEQTNKREQTNKVEEINKEKQGEKVEDITKVEEMNKEEEMNQEKEEIKKDEEQINEEKQVDKGTKKNKKTKKDNEAKKEKEDKDVKKDKKQTNAGSRGALASIKERSSSLLRRTFALGRGQGCCIPTWNPAHGGPGALAPKFHVGSVEEDNLEDIQLDTPEIEMQNASSSIPKPLEKENKNDEECSGNDKTRAIIHKEDESN